MENILNVKILESEKRSTCEVIHKRSHSICHECTLKNSNENSFRIFDSVKSVPETGSRSKSLDRKEENRRIFCSCSKMISHSNEGTSNGSNFMNERISKWDEDKRLKNRTKVINIKPSIGNTKGHQADQLFQNRNFGNTLMEKSSPSKADFKSLLTMFLKRSSIYALNQVGNSSTTKRKVFWALILVLGLIGSSYQIGEYLMAYFTYPVIVNIDITSTLNNDFPAVTVCNINNVRSEYLSCLRNQTKYDMCEPSDIDHKYLNVSFTEDLNGKSCDFNFKIISESFIRRFLWQSLFLVLDTESQIKYGHQKSDFIYSCSFNGEECSLDNFTSFVSNVYGNCFTFNSANESKSSLKTSYVGPNSGLDLELKLDADKYAHYTSSVGARVQIHDPYHVADVDEDGINISPGFETSITLSKVEMVRLEAPYKDHCKNYRLGESTKLCQLKCFNEYFTKNCSCSPYSYALNLTNVRHCNFSRLSDLCCVYPLYNKMECNCPLSCNDTDYRINIFSAIWPSDNYFNLNNIKGTHWDVYEARANMVKLKVYYDTLDVVTYRQKAMYQSSELFSQIGGQMGLWLGLSLVAIFECIENFILIWKYREKQIKG